MSKQPSDTDMGAKEPKTILLKGIFYGHLGFLFCFVFFFGFGFCFFFFFFLFWVFAWFSWGFSRVLVFF